MYTEHAKAAGSSSNFVIALMRMEHQPIVGDRFSAQLAGDVGLIAVLIVEVVAHDRLGDLVDTEILGHEAQQFIDPKPAVIVVCLRVLIVAAQERPPHDSAAAMIGAHFVFIVNVFARSASHRHVRGSWLFQFSRSTNTASSY